MMCENPMLAMPSERDVPEVVVLADGDWPSGRVAAALLRQARCVVWPSTPNARLWRIRPSRPNRAA